VGTSGFALFETAIGPCGIAWGEGGLTSVQLPERTPEATRARLRRLHPDVPEATPPADVQATVDGIKALLRGEPVDLSEVPLDLAGVPDFNRRVYEVTRAIPSGKTLTYGEVANRIGEPGAAQAVGQALGRNPIPIVVPCHRVLGAGGKLVGFSANGGTSTKRTILVIEGALADEPTLF
jgi:methylated-DNA-[protein]-cysteine S-methyltransferase